MIGPVRKIIGMVYEMVFLPAILDQVESGAATIKAECEASLPVGRHFKLPSAARMLNVKLELTGTRRTDGSRCRCSNSTHLDDDLGTLRSALKDLWSDDVEEAFLAGKPLSVPLQMGDAKYDGVELYPCSVTCTLTIVDSTK